jgi:hypothetical protein
MKPQEGLPSSGLLSVSTTVLHGIANQSQDHHQKTSTGKQEPTSANSESSNP